MNPNLFDLIARHMLAFVGREQADVRGGDLTRGVNNQEAESPRDPELRAKDLNRQGARDARTSTSKIFLVFRFSRALRAFAVRWYFGCTDL
jgi:hypothetical protein